MATEAEQTIIDAVAVLLADERKPTVPAVLPIVDAYYRLPGCDLGGSLHIVLEDSNVDTIWVESCRDRAQAEGDPAGFALANLLLRCSKTQRWKLFDRHAYSWS